MLTPDQFWVELKRRVRDWVYEILSEEEVWNSSMWMDGKVGAVAADGKHADIYINGATTVTPSVPIAPHVGTLNVNDQVVVLNRARGRDLIVMYKKVL
jgi:hypothetical protein